MVPLVREEVGDAEGVKDVALRGAGNEVGVGLVAPHRPRVRRAAARGHQRAVRQQQAARQSAPLPSAPPRASTSDTETVDTVDQGRVA